MSDKRKRWRVLGNSQTTLIAVSLERSCGWEEARGAVAVTAALWPRPGKSCVSTCVCVCVSLCLVGIYCCLQAVNIATWLYLVTFSATE